MSRIWTSRCSLLSFRFHFEHCSASPFTSSLVSSPNSRWFCVTVVESPSFARLGLVQTLAEGFTVALNRCAFFGWLDPPMCARSVMIIPGLLRNINNGEEVIKNLNEEIVKWNMLMFVIGILYL
ncbi:hypothetical protein LXL04_006116 [Taraxacum kok-saghyz]